MRTKTLPAASAAPRRSYLPLVLVALTGFGLALYRFGLHVLDPTNISWFRGDSVGHFLTWHFFRREAWGLPPGQVERFMAPLGTSVGSADALPLLAFPFKLFNAALPPDFQYLGPWLFISYALQGVFGYLLARTFCRNRWLALLAGLFFLFSPIMIFRAGHIALSSHWLLLFALWHYFRTAKEPSFRLRPYAGLWLLIVALVGLVHPYLAAMVFPMAFISLLREWTFSKRLGLVSALGLLFGMSGVLFLEWWLAGLLGTRQELESWGFDFFSMNVNALVNPLTRSRLFPTLPAADGQYEGFAYLGLGVIGLGVFALVLLFRPSRNVPRRIFKRLRVSGHLPLALLALGFALYALGKKVMLGQGELFEFGLFTNFGALTDVFRAPGRFIWPTYYLIYVAVLAYLVQKLPPKRAALVLSVGFLVQVGDLKLNQPFTERRQPFTKNLDEQWEALVAPFEMIAVIPAFERTTANRGDWAEFAYLAANEGKGVTTGIVARAPRYLDLIEERLEREVIEGRGDPETLYVFSAVTFAETYLTKLEPGLRCHELGDYVACYTGRDLGFGPGIDLTNYAPPGFERVSLADYLERYQDQTIVLVAKEGVGRTLGEGAAFLKARGSSIGWLPPKEAYAAVLQQGRVVFEKVRADELIRRQWGRDETIAVGEPALPKRLHVFSGGTKLPEAAIFVGGEPVYKTERGLNVAVLDEAFKVVSHASFDTFVTDRGITKKRRQ